MNLRLSEKSSKFLLYLGSERLLRFVSLHPEWADIRVTESCNSRCVTCYAWKNKPDGELTTEEIKDALSQMKGIGIKNVVFIGGEPLLRKDIGVLVKEASLLNFKDIIVVTNGLLLEDKAEELLKSGVTHITVSIDGVGKTNDEIRGIAGSYDKSIRGIKAVQRLKKEMNLDVAVTIITTILLNQNVDEIPKLVELSRSLDIHWFFNLLDLNINLFKEIPFSELLVKNGKKIDETIDYLKQVCERDPQLIPSCDHMLEFARTYLKGKSLVEKINPYDFHCVHGHKLLYLGSHGEIYPGCYAMDPIGNIRKDKLQDTVGSKQAKKVAKKMYMMDCPGCTNRYEFNIASKHLISHLLRCKKKKQKEETL
ncbi:hypothetical protein AC477_05145 [miscellaneous Crenarchaeota group-1 archaeon SG8-32-1]|uniref:Radical SAM core domain-containing protein n=1 Tax=miscellaneous Crenarchaeota group-1 archaeon SG8-32-1 TaxID=1685124 RepID=A0A0M0BPM2_9ARCH|nr:MAG: hypothetical protein AC477_05145 [miscellaneous Crenarchaeota group-1 archaeon SG8-32-1]